MADKYYNVYNCVSDVKVLTFHNKICQGNYFDVPDQYLNVVLVVPDFNVGVITFWTTVNIGIPVCPPTTTARILQLSGCTIIKETTSPADINSAVDPKSVDFTKVADILEIDDCDSCSYYGRISVTKVSSDCNKCNGQLGIKLTPYGDTTAKITSYDITGPCNYNYDISGNDLPTTLLLENLCPGEYEILVSIFFQGQTTYLTATTTLSGLDCPIDCCNTTLILESWDTDNVFDADPDGCCECLPPPAVEPFPEPERIYPKPVRYFYPVNCDDKATIKFAKGYWTLIEKLKYGINRVCTDIDLAKLWMTEQINHLKATEDPDWLCHSAPASGCIELPKDCQVLVSGFGKTTIILTAGEDITPGKVVYLGAGGLVYLNQPADLSTYQRVIGFSNNAAATGSAVNVITMGPINIAGLSTQSIYYTIADGNISTSVATSGISQQVGIASNSNTLIVDIKQAIIIS